MLYPCMHSDEWCPIFDIVYTLPGMGYRPVLTFITFFKKYAKAMVLATNTLCLCALSTHALPGIHTDATKVTIPLKFKENEEDPYG